MALELMGRNIFCDNHDYGGSHRKNKKGDHVIHINLRDVFVNYSIIFGRNKEGTGEAMGFPAGMYVGASIARPCDDV